MGRRQASSQRALRNGPSAAWAVASTSVMLFAVTMGARADGGPDSRAGVPDTPIARPDSPLPSSGGQPPLPTEQCALTRPSTVPEIVRDRIQRIEAALEATPTPGVLEPETVAALSDNLVTVNAQGELDLEFHSAGPVGLAQRADLTALGATILLSTGETPAVPGPSSSLGPQIIVARIAHAKVEAAACLPWVAAVRPVEKSQPD